MGIPYIQLDSDFLTGTSKVIAALLRVSRQHVIGMAADLVTFAITETSSEDHPPHGNFIDPEAGLILEGAMEWTGEPGRAANAFERAGVLEKLEIGYRVRGCDRYVVVWENRQARSDAGRKAAKARWGKRPQCDSDASAMRSHSDGNASVVRSQCDLDASKCLDGDGDVEEKKQKKQSGAEPFGLEQQDERTKPQRKPSEQQSFASWFESERKEALGAEWSEDVDLKGARLNKALDWIGREPEDALTRAARIYLADPYRRGQSPPCSLRWFAADRAEYLDKAKRQIRGAA